MKQSRILLCMLLVLVLIFTMALPASAMADPATETKSLRILFTHDMHSSLLPAKIKDPGGNLVEAGGFARLHTVIQNEKTQDPDGTLLVDAGDYSMGTLFQTLESTQAPELCLMGAMGYDAVTAGNHEFDYYIGGFTKSLQAAKQKGGPLPQYVISNMDLPQGDPKADALRKAMDDYGAKEYTVLNKGGIKIGLFGLMGENAAHDAPNSKPATFTDIIEASKKMVDILKNQEKADLIVCLSHSGTWTNPNESEDEQLAKAVPDIDVIISGHTHTLLPKPIITGHTIIASCGSSNETLGELEISYDNGWKVKDYSLKPIDATVKDDAAMLEKIGVYKGLVDEYLKPYGYTYDQVIARSPYQFEDSQYMYDHPADYPLGNLLSDAMVYAVKKAEGDSYEPVDAAVVPMGIIRATINQGDVTVSDAFNILSLGTGPDEKTGYPLICVYLTGTELRNVCEVDASVTPLLGDAQLFISGIRYTYAPDWLIFNKVQNAELSKPDGSTAKIEPDKLYRVVCGLYTGQMLSYVKSKSFGIISIVPKDKDGNPIDMENLEKHIIYAEANGEKQEIKEWEMVVQYMQSFPEKDGAVTIPDAYATEQGRKITVSPGIFTLIGNMNLVAWIVVLIVAVILALIVWIIVLIATRKKRKAKRAARRAIQAEREGEKPGKGTKTV